MSSRDQGAELKWDIIVRPKSKWYNLDLKGVWQYRDLVALFVKRDFLALYKQTVFGPLWMLLQPLLMTLTFSIIFGRVANISTGDAPRLLFYMVAYIPWTYFSDCLNRTATTFTSGAGIFGKVYFPRMVTPISMIISSFLRFLVQLVLIVGLYFFFVYRGTVVRPNAHLAYFPLLILLLAGYGLAAGLVISALTSKYRDLTFIIPLVLQLLMYGSSVVIGFAQFGPELQKYLRWNPLLWIFEAIRYSLLGSGTGLWSWHALAYATGIMLVLLVAGIFSFSSRERTFIDTV
ncbi:MAG TPA: ABC transporter permease [Bacteroidia bacterium]|nr:ABC transporter permease [Bacteroidia bacterium]